MAGSAVVPEGRRHPTRTGGMGRSLTAGATDVASQDLVGARGFEPPVPTFRIVLPEWIVNALRGVA